MVSKRLVSAPLLLLASGCAVVGPMVDRSFENAPYAACAELAGASAGPVAQAPVSVGCFDIVGRTMSAGGMASPTPHGFTADGLVLTGPAAFTLAAREGCAGLFTNLVVEYSAPAGATANVVATNALGGALGMKRIEAKPSPEVRRLVVREMGDPLKNPAVAEFTPMQGELVLRSVCLKGY